MVVRKPVTYALDGTTFESVLVYDDAVRGPRPGLVMAPNFLGITDGNLAQAQHFAGSRYVVLLADLYGQGVRPHDPAEAMKLIGGLRADRKALRARMVKALEALRREGAVAGLDAKRVAAIGFCFGGTCVVELAKSGADVAAAVSFHGGLDAPAPHDGKVQARILALHGAEDPAQSPEDLQAFVQDLRQAGADWTLVQFGGAVHSFTDPTANRPPRSQYHPTVARRAFAMMHDCLAEAFGD